MTYECSPPINPVRISIAFDPTAKVIRLSFSTQYLVAYDVQSSPDLKTWTTITSYASLNFGYVSIPISIGAQAKSFYRVIARS